MRGRNSRSNPAVGEIASLALAKTPMLNCSVLSFFGFLVLSSLWSFSAVFAAAPFPVFYTSGIEFAPDDVVADTRKVFDPAAANENHSVLLQIVSNAWNISDDLVPVGEPDLGDLPDSGVRFLRGGGVDLDANPALERRALLERDRTVMEEIPGALKSQALGLGFLAAAGFADQLIDRGHFSLVSLRALANNPGIT